MLFSSFLMISWAWWSSSHRCAKDCVESKVLKSIQSRNSASDSNTDYVVNADDSQISVVWVGDEKQQHRPIMNDPEMVIPLLAIT